MSVINKMLRDLDKRGGLGPRSLEDGIRDVDRVAPAGTAKRPWGPISAALVLVVLIAAVAWYLTSAPQPKPPVVAKAATPVVAKPGPAQTPPPAAASEVKPAPSPVPVTAPVVSAPVATPPATAASPVTPPAATAPPTASVASATPEPSKAAPSAKAESITPGSMKALASESVAKSNAANESTSNAIAAAQGRVLSPPSPPVVASVPAAPPKPAPAVAAAVVEPRVPMPAAGTEARVAAAAPSGTDPRVAIDRVDRTTGTSRAVSEYRSANDLLAQGRVDAALARYADALRSDPRHVQARQSLVVLLLDQGKSAEAQNALREGVAAMPQNTSWATLLARLQVQGGDAKAALETLERALPHAQGQAEFHAFLATLLQMQSRHREAITHYETSVRIGPESARWLTGLAISLEEEKRIPEARDVYRRALAAGGLSRELETFAERKLKQLQ